MMCGLKLTLPEFEKKKPPMTLGFLGWVGILAQFENKKRPYAL